MCPLGVLEFQSALAGGIGERLDAPMKEKCATVENDLADAGFDGALGDELADSRSSGLVGARLETALDAFSSVEAAASVTPFTSSIT